MVHLPQKWDPIGFDPQPFDAEGQQGRARQELALEAAHAGRRLGRGSAHGLTGRGTGRGGPARGVAGRGLCGWRCHLQVGHRSPNHEPPWKSPRQERDGRAAYVWEWRFDPRKRNGIAVGWANEMASLALFGQ